MGQLSDTIRRLARAFHRLSVSNPYKMSVIQYTVGLTLSDIFVQKYIDHREHDWRRTTRAQFGDSSGQTIFVLLRQPLLLFNGRVPPNGDADSSDEYFLQQIHPEGQRLFFHSIEFFHFNLVPGLREQPRPTCPGIGPRSQTSVGQQIQNAFVRVFFTTQKYEMLQGVRKAIVIVRLGCCVPNFQK
ncbi:unnamed protein product, partial [Nesidiocoris tenuis]